MNGSKFPGTNPREKLYNQLGREIRTDQVQCGLFNCRRNVLDESEQKSAAFRLDFTIAGLAHTISCATCS